MSVREMNNFVGQIGNLPEMDCTKMPDLLKKIIEDHKAGKSLGIYSVCSAHRYVLEAAMQQAKKDDSLLLIEATSNQVDQFGGYSGMNPAQFVNYVAQISREMDFCFENIILGGDHLGPNAWQNQVAEKAMQLALAQVKAYVEAEFTKIHLDTSMRCADDESLLRPATIAERAAFLCEVAEQASINKKRKPLYVIGTEVPIPGGAHEELSELTLTSVVDLQETIELTKTAFMARDLNTAWERVIAVVVQPGVEFSDSNIIEYDRNKARELSVAIEKYDHLVYEAHSTDYQQEEKLREMVEDHFAILKVGPGLTYAFREAVFALAQIEKEMAFLHKGMVQSNINAIIDSVMLKKPEYWQKHYHGNNAELSFARKYGFSDRIRYYWPNREVNAAFEKLIHNFDENSIPLSLLSQFMPNQYHAVRNGIIKPVPAALIHHKILEVLALYAAATQ